jgi:hypothetical protein
MQHRVQIFQIDREAKPNEAPRAIGDFEVAADGHEEARAAACAKLVADGHTVRSISFVADGGLAAVVTQAAVRPSPAQVQRALRGV